jgi:hypothetical protein
MSRIYFCVTECNVGVVDGFLAQKYIFLQCLMWNPTLNAKINLFSIFGYKTRLYSEYATFPLGVNVTHILHRMYNNFQVIQFR